MRQRARKAIILVSLLLFPITLNFFSPYVSIDGAMRGVISGSLLLFAILFVASIFLGRAWCAWLCPMAGLSEMALGANNRNVRVKKLRVVRYVIFCVWAAFLIALFVLAGGIKGVDPLHLTDSGISVDEPAKYIVYYFVLAVFIILTFGIGKRGACHAICWMSPFMTGGYSLGRLLGIKQLRIRADSAKCVGCGACDRKCPMSIDVSTGVKDGWIKSSDCILCGECVDGCAKGALGYGFVRPGE